MFDMLKNAITRRTVLKGAAAACATTTLVGCSTNAPKTASKLAIIHTNDSHGHDIRDSESLGMAAVAQLKADYEAKGYEVLLFDAGDVVQGEVVVQVSEGENGIDFMNHVGYDVMTLGNHEFDFGQNKIAEYLAEANFPLISANVLVNATGDTLVDPNTTFTLADGTKVGVFGLTTPETYTKASPLLVKGLTFLEEKELYACAQRQADALRADGCKLVVCLSHLGESDAADPNRAKDVIANTSGIDLFVDGHDHEEQGDLVSNAKGEPVLVVETGCYTHAIGVVTWEDGKLTNLLERFGEYQGQDAVVATYIEQVVDYIDGRLSDVIATTDFELDGNRNPGVRTKETNLGDLVTDAMMWEARQMADDVPDAALVNGGTIRDTIPVGDITTKTILDVLPFLNYVATVQVTGAQLLEAIEASCAANPDAMGGFPQVSGITYTLDPTVPYEKGPNYPDSTFASPANPGARVTITDVGGRGFDLNETYTIVSTDFACAGGDTYYVFAQAAQTTMKGINYLLSDCVVYYIAEACNGVVPEKYAQDQGRITIVGEEQAKTLEEAA